MISLPNGALGRFSFSTYSLAVEPVENTSAIFSLLSPEVQSEFRSLAPAMSSSVLSLAASSCSFSSCSCSIPKLLPVPRPALLALLQALALWVLRLRLSRLSSVQGPCNVWWHSGFGHTAHPCPHTGCDMPCARTWIHTLRQRGKGWEKLLSMPQVPR